MPRSISLCHPNPKERFRKTLDHALGSASTADAAVAFITKSGVEFFSSWVTKLGPDRCRLTTSVQFPTDLDALCRLSASLKDRLHIHLGSKTPQEKLSWASPLIHSKILQVANGSGHTFTFIGSHNWTAPALDGVNLEASVCIECEPEDSFASDVKTHLDACFAASVPFDPADLQFYKALQRDYFPKRPEQPEREEMDEFVRVPDPPAVVIHAEDFRSSKLPEDLLLYLPLDRFHPHGWFDPTAPTRIYLYLYPPGTLLGKQPLSALPFLYEGGVSTFGHVNNPILGQRVTCQIQQLGQPKLEDVPGNNIPALMPDVEAQVVAGLLPCQQMRLPVYHVGSRPAIRVQPRYDAEAKGQRLAPDASDVVPLPFDRLQHYTPESTTGGRFVFSLPLPVWSVALSVPGSEFYPQDVRGIVRESIRRTADQDDIVIEVGPVEGRYRYIYQVKFVLLPPSSTHRR
jgi:hypothetical protein